MKIKDDLYETYYPVCLMSYLNEYFINYGDQNKHTDPKRAWGRGGILVGLPLCPLVLVMVLVGTMASWALMPNESIG